MRSSNSHAGTKLSIQKSTNIGQKTGGVNLQKGPGKLVKKFGTVIKKPSGK